jgi:cysteine desulfurase/selenocysteine lyase
MVVKVMKLDVELIREDFPVLKREVRPNVPLVYLDSTATSQKPEQVIVAMDKFYQKITQIFTEVCTLAEGIYSPYERARQKIAEFIKSPSNKQIVFMKHN